MLLLLLLLLLLLCDGTQTEIRLLPVDTCVCVHGRSSVAVKATLVPRVPSTVVPKPNQCMQLYCVVRGYALLYLPAPLCAMGEKSTSCT